MKNVDYSRVDINGGFWQKKQKMLRDVTVGAIYDRFSETHRFSALECKWDGDESEKPHIFWDSDVAKWVEGVSYLIAREPNEKWRSTVEHVIDCFIENQDENGYFNSHFLVTEQENRFKNRGDHELYCAGHWIEAAIAYFEATGERRFLDAVCRFADYIERVFKIERSAAFITPGHPELELALVRLYETTGERRYFELAEYFINEHGANSVDGPISRQLCDPEYNQDAVPLRARRTVDGHAVRALYLLSGMIDVAARTGDAELAEACYAMFDDCVNKKMYITGAVGFGVGSEAFSREYFLPNRSAYAETCASIALAMAAQRMLLLEEDGKYADAVERVIFNGMLSGISQDGRSFFYVNPLEIDLDFNHVNKFAPEKDSYPETQRKTVFGCSCCPPNILRFIASIGGYVLSESSDTVFVNQFMNADSDIVKITTDYPADGRVLIERRDMKGKRLAVRIPSWCKHFTISEKYTLKNRYAFIDSENGSVEVNFDLPVRLVYANRRNHDNAGKCALMRGPVVYCAERVDNFKDLQAVRVYPCEDFELKSSSFSLPTIVIPALIPRESDKLYLDSDSEGYDTVRLTLIPYHAFANRGESDMVVWFHRK